MMSQLDLAIADLDEEGLADLAAANHETDHVTLLFGIARGAFEHRDHPRLPVDVSPHPHAVRLHEIDSDGHADLLVDDRSPSPSGCSGVAGMAYSRGRHRCR